MLIIEARTAQPNHETFLRMETTLKTIN